MPSPKYAIIALIILTTLALCPACGDDDSHSSKSESPLHEVLARTPDQKEFACKDFSLLLSKNMKLETCEEKGITIVIMTADKGIVCTINAYQNHSPAEAFLAGMINGFTKKLKSMDFKQTEKGFEEVQRTIGGRQITGMMMKFALGPKIFQAEFFVYPKEKVNLYFLFFAPVNDQILAESYFKIITDSIR